jgi:MacB-like periplasmic core domain
LSLDLHPDATVLTFAVLAAFVTALVCGAGPVFEIWRSGADGLRHDGKRITGRNSGRKVLVAGQLAVSLVLVAGAGLFLKNLYGLAAADLGFRPERVTAFEFAFPRVASKQHQAQVDEEMFERLAARGFQVTYTSPGIYEDGGWSRTLSVVDAKQLPPGGDTEVQMLAVAPGFFEMLGVQLLAGRTFDRHDRKGSEPVAIVNETFAPALSGRRAERDPAASRNAGYRHWPCLECADQRPVRHSGSGSAPASSLRFHGRRYRRLGLRSGSC